MKKLNVTLLVLALGLASGGAAFALNSEPGSLLVFPLFDSRPGVASLITITNTHLSEGVWIEYRYIDGYTCEKSDRTEYLTPNDTITVVASTHDFDQSQGYLYVYAKSDRPSDSPPIDHDWLVGQASVFDGIRVLEASYVPFSYFVNGNEGDLADKDGDGILDLNGWEYEQCGDFYIQPRFFGQADGSDNPGLMSEIVMINLSGGVQFDAEVDFAIYNDNEVPSSAGFTFNCWHRSPLLEISGAFSASNLKSGDDDEEVVGLPEFETGWFSLDGVVASSDCTAFDDPVVLFMLIETTGRQFAGTDLPFTSWAKQGNGDLLPRGCHGDS